MLVCKEATLHTQILHCTPLGESMLEDFIRRIQAEGTQGGSGRTALVLPSPFLLEAARQQLRRTQQLAWEFPRVLSLDELAAAFCGRRIVSRVEQEFVIADLVRFRTDEDLHRCFGRIMNFAGFIAALARLFDELNMAAVTPEELAEAWAAVDDDLERDRTRGAAIGSLFSAYHERLAACGATDLAGSYLLAAAALEDEQPVVPFDKIYLAEFSILSPVRLRLLAALKRKTVLEIGICFEKNRPAVFSAVEPVYEALVGMGFHSVAHPVGKNPSNELAQIRRRLFSEQASPVRSTSKISRILAPDKAREMAAAADKIKELLTSGECRPEAVAVVVRDSEAYPGMRRIFLERGVPIDLPERLEADKLAITRLVLSWTDLAVSRGERAAVLNVLKSPYLAGRFAWRPDELESLLLAEIIRTWRDWEAAIRRRQTDEAARKAWAEDMNELESMASLWRKPRTWPEWTALLTELTVWLDIPATLRRLRASGTLELPRMKAELSALAILLEVADEMANFGGLAGKEADRVNAGDFADTLKRMLQGRFIAVSGREEAGVRVVTPGIASGMNFSAVVLLGLTEGEFPSLPRESWLLDDGERRILSEVGVVLATAAQRSAAADFQFALAAAMATERLIMTTVTDGETLPSRYMDEICRLFDSEKVETLHFGPQQIVAGQPGDAWGEIPLLRGALNGIRQGGEHCGEWRRAYDALAHRIPASLPVVAAIEADREGRYAGLVSSELISMTCFSPSALERYAFCPFVFFVTDVLCLGEWAEATEGIDPLATGALWHEILANFLGCYRGKMLDPALKEQYARELKELLRTKVAEEERSGRIVPGVWWKFERPLFEAALISWLEAEISRQQESAAVPEYFEWSFGLHLRPGSDPASTEKFLALGPDAKIFLQGKIDRIDHQEAGNRVVDYKTGRAPRLKDVEQGLRLQIPVYMMAVESLLERPVSSGEYQPVHRPLSPLVLPGEKTTKQALFERAEHFVQLAVEGISRGSFPPRPAGFCPDYCPARTFCRKLKTTNGTAAEEQQDE